MTILTGVVLAAGLALLLVLIPAVALQVLLRRVGPPLTRGDDPAPARKAPHGRLEPFHVVS
jgi:hypothetical protein